MFNDHAVRRFGGSRDYPVFHVIFHLEVQDMAAGQPVQQFLFIGLAKRGFVGDTGRVLQKMQCRTPNHDAHQHHKTHCTVNARRIHHDHLAGKTHVALGLGLAACQKGMSVGFTTAATLVHELMEARDDRRLLNLQRQLARLRLLIIDELGFVPLSTTGAELLFEVFSQRYERGSVLVTTNLPFDEWTDVFGSERLTGALLDRLTHHVHILEMNGDSYRLKHSRQNAASQVSDDPVDS